jgi:hypothetical protein
MSCKLYYTVPSLKSIVINYIVDYENINGVLNPKEDWDVDNSHLFNTRMPVPEIWEYLEEVLSGIKTFTQVKSEMRAVLLQRPFDLDLVQLQAAIPLLFNHLPVVMSKQIWIEAFLMHFEARLPFCLYFKLHYGAPMDLNAVQCIMDGCHNADLRELLQKREKELQIDEIVLEWLLENVDIDK